MKLASITLLLNDDVVAGGFSFRLIFNAWEIGAFLILVACLIYFIRRKRKNSRV